MNNKISLTEKAFETMDTMVLPASTADIYNRMIHLGFITKDNANRVRADVSSALGKLRKAGKVFSEHDDSGVLLWDMHVAKKPVIRVTTEKRVAIRDEIARVRHDLPTQIVLAELFDELAQSLSHAANVLRRFK